MEDVSLPSTDNNGTLSSEPVLKRGQKREIADDDNWDDLRSYMRVKKRKLDEQFRGMGNRKESSIFEGVTIYVNGWTQPNADELKRMIHEHGGMYKFNLYSNTKVTHTIATNLPNSKVKNLGDSIVCTPNWIVDSIAAGYCLPVESYRLYSNWSRGQKVLNIFGTRPPQKFIAREVDISNHPHSSTCIVSPTDHYFDLGAAVAPKVPVTSSRNVLTTTCSLLEQGSLKEVKHDSSSITTSTQPTKSLQPSEASPKVFPSKASEDKVSEFFKHSRLHYLSTWSTELKQFTTRMRTKIHPRYPKLPTNISLRVQQCRAVVHIDLDCFFVSVSIQSQPQLKGKPVAVTHAKTSTHVRTSKTALGNEDVQSFSCPTDPSSRNSIHSRPSLESTSDIASCSYEARKVGVHNGMSVGAAMKLCPHLILLPYDFNGYRKVSQIFYETLLLYSSVVEAVSCDEAYVEFTDFTTSFDQVEKLVKDLRAEIEHKTGCTVSAGISHNMLLARLSTRVAKPNGQFFLPKTKIDDFLAAQKVRDLPGVGYSMAMKLKEMSIESCEDLKKLPLAVLQSNFGEKTGKMLYNYCRGNDTRDLKLHSERKSVSVDINFGIRFTDISEAESLIRSLAEELERRVKDAGVSGGTVTLKMKTRRQDAPQETWKYLGHGPCDNVTRSVTLLEPTRHASEISRLAVNLMNQVKPSACDIRGMGLQLSKLVDDTSSSHNHGADIRKIFQSTTASPVTRSDLLFVILVHVCFDTHHFSHCRSVMLKSSEPSQTPLSVPISSKVQSSAQYLVKEIPLTNVMCDSSSSAAVSANESFFPDLPPQSQLDSNVLKALPASLQDKILRRYGDRDALKPIKCIESIHCNVKEMQDSSLQDELDTPPVPSSKGEEHTVIIDDEVQYVKRLHHYISDWITNSLDGPIDSDVQMFAEFLLSLLRNNLELVSVTLKYIRSTILQLQLSKWYNSFDLLLSSIQDKVRVVYSGKLLIDCIVQKLL